jgi:hypothetical protein
MAMNGFVPGLPKDKEVAPNSSHRAKGPSGAGIDARVDAHTSNILILFDAPLSRHVAIKDVSPANSCLFTNQLMVTSRTLGLVDGAVGEPRIKVVDKDIQQSWVAFIGFMSCTEMHKQIVLPEAPRGKGAADDMVTVFRFHGHGLQVPRSEDSGW